MTAAQLTPRPVADRWYWRLLRFRPLRLLVGVAFVVPPALLHFAWHPTQRPWPLLVVGLVKTLALALAYVAFVRLVEQRPALELSAPRSLREFGLGAAIGGSLMACTIAILAVAGAYRTSGIDAPRALLAGVGSQVPQALLEELLFRALLFRICEEALGSWPALAIQAALFGAIHLVNPHASLAGAVAVALTGGVLLTAAFMLTRRLWLAWGLHFAWNFTQGFVFGCEVSGSGAMRGLLKATLSGPAWLTGGSFGVELSAVAIALCLVADVALLRRARGRGQLVARRRPG